jgi:hypothetical protein
MSRAFLRSFAFRFCIAFALHEVLLQALTRSHAVATLFSPGTHTPLASLATATAFLILRVFVVLLWPAAVASAARLFWERSRAGARRVAPA